MVCLKERQNNFLIYFVIAVVFKGALVSVGAMIVAGRLFPPVLASSPTATPLVAQLPTPATTNEPVWRTSPTPTKTHQ
jgi:hypothetical protein